MRSLSLNSIRGRLVLWYLAVLALLLAALGIFQWVTVGERLRTATAESVRADVCQELTVLGPSYVRTAADLDMNAPTLARLLGGPITAVSIVTPTGQTLASHDFGPPGAGRPLRLSGDTIWQLIGQATSASAAQRTAPACPQLETSNRYSGGSDLQQPAQQLVSHGTVLVLAMPLGPPGRPVGYALLGRSLAPENDALSRVLRVFALGAAVALILAAFVALPIINTALRPLKRVTQTAERIAAGDLEARTELKRSPDEVGRLGEAFDRMVDRLQSALQTAAASEERMRRFLADASHELRTPATVLRGSSQVLLRHAGGTSPQTVGALQDMHEEAVRLSALIEDLLTLSRLDEGQMPEPQPVPVRSFVEDFLDRYGSLWPERAITVDDSGLNGATASINPETLRRIITNLVDNAARYSRTSGSIRIGGSHGDARVSVSIADEGPGLPPDEAAHMFDRFYRANKSRSRGSGGTGLGLAIVHDLVEGSGGTIRIDTAPDRGTTVTVELPAASDKS